MRLTQNGNVRLAYDVVGQGPPMLLLHGRMTSSLSWRRLGYVDALATRWQLILMDLRGHGESDRPHDDRAYGADQLAGDAAAVLDAAGIDRCPVVGYSMGGRVAFNMAAHRPDRVSRLVVGGAGPYGPALSREDELAMASTMDKGIDAYIDAIAVMLGVEEVPEPVREELRANDVGALSALARAGADWPPVVDLLRAWGGAALLFGGTHDPIWPQIKRAHGELPGTQLVPIEALGHGEVLLRSDLVVPILAAALETPG